MTESDLMATMERLLKTDSLVNVRTKVDLDSDSDVTKIFIECKNKDLIEVLKLFVVEDEPVMERINGVTIERYRIKSLLNGRINSYQRIWFSKEFIETGKMILETNYTDLCYTKNSLQQLAALVETAIRLKIDSNNEYQVKISFKKMGDA